MIRHVFECFPHSCSSLNPSQLTNFLLELLPPGLSLYSCSSCTFAKGAGRITFLFFLETPLHVPESALGFVAVNWDFMTSWYNHNFGVVWGRGGGSPLGSWLEPSVSSGWMLFSLQFAKRFRVLCVLFDRALLQSPCHLQTLLIMILFQGFFNNWFNMLNSMRLRTGAAGPVKTVPIQFSDFYSQLHFSI